MDAINTFFDQFSNQSLATIGLVDIVFVLIVSFLISLFMTIIYRNVYSGVSYSNRYVSTLILVSLITTMIVLTIRSNIIISLGMVGALSIVRFRTPLKEPIDLAFMFWAVAIGISMGALLYDVAIIFSLFTGVVLLVITRIKNVNQVYMLIIEYNSKEVISRAVDEELSNIKYILRSKKVTGGIVELVLEITQVQLKTDIASIISGIEGVRSVSLIGYNGEYLG